MKEMFVTEVRPNGNIKMMLLSDKSRNAFINELKVFKCFYVATKNYILIHNDAWCSLKEYMS